MEILIRQQLSDAERHQDVEALKSTYKLIKSANEGKSALDSSEIFSSDLYVLCAEQAHKMDFPEISKDCLQMYFKGKPPINQFLGRAYLCQSQLHTPVSTDNMEQFEKFIINLLKAIDFALGDTRYYFLIYNASVIYWRVIRPFFKPGLRHFLIPSLIQIVPALKHPSEEDKDWTAELMIELIECFLDASRTEEAIEFSSTAAAFIKANVPGRYKQLFSLMVRHKLVEDSQIEEELGKSPNLSIIYKIQTIKLQLDKNEIPEEAETDLSNIYELLKKPRRKLNHNERISLLLELARLSLRLNCIPVAYSCISDLQKCKITDLGKEIELDCLECDYEVKKLGPKIETYTKSVVEAQLKEIHKLELILKRAIRLKDPNIIQAVCTTQWNICLPLLQHNLTQYIWKPLLAIAEILEKIDSMLILLRCQVHMEIALIEEKADRIEVAMEHLQKAIYLDNNGQYNEYLKMAFHRLNLNTMLYKSLERLEDQANLMIEQAKKGTPKDSVRKKRSLLVNAGLALAPEAFQIVLDCENEAKVASSKNKGQISYLCAKAEHHKRSVEKADGHLKRIGHENEKERIRLWSEIAKTARKQSVWDVCRAACRFCLLYDDCQIVKTSKRRKLFRKKGSWNTTEEEQEGAIQRESPSPTKLFSLERDLLRTLAEVRFINAEATVQLLRMEGVQLNDHAVIPVDTSLHSAIHPQAQVEHVSEWNTYSAWINKLSQYAMENFLRAAKIGEELNEAWIVHNTVVYVLNHNKHLIASKRQREIVEPLQTLFSAIKNTGHCGDTTILVTLCNALARGLILPWIPKPISKPDEKKVTEEGPIRRKKPPPKVFEKTTSTITLSVDSSGVHDIKAAIEVCDFAMRLPNGSVPDEPVPIAMRQQVIATWVKAKQLVQHQIGRWHGSEDESNDEGSSPMTKVFIGIEMYSCNGLGLMDFSLPNLSQLVKMALECNWTDSLVQLQTLTRLAHYAHGSHDHELAMTCSQKALEIGDKALENADGKKREMNDYTARQEMLSIAACTQGKSMMENLAGKKHLRAVASKCFVESARYAGEAGDISLAMIATRHFWNACLPFIGSSADRQQLKIPTEILLKSIIKASEAKNKQEMEQMLELHQWPTVDFQSSSSSNAPFLPGADEDLTLRTFLYVVLFQVYADKNDWEASLKVLDDAVQILPRTKHRLPLFKHMVMVKARLGRNYIMEIQKFRDESEDYLSNMWHRLASVSPNLLGQLSCYQNAIDILRTKEFELKKVDNLLALAEWLYCNQFPLNETIKPLEWAIHILLYLKPIRKSPDEEDSRDQITVGDLRNIKQLEALFRAHTIMAVIAGHDSPCHEQHCLMSYAFVMRMWQISLASAGAVLKAQAGISPTQQSPPKGKGKKDAKQPSGTQKSPIPPPKKDKSSKEGKQSSPTPPPKKDKSSKEGKQRSPTPSPKKDKSSKEGKQPAGKQRSPSPPKKDKFSKEGKQAKRKGTVDALPGSMEEWGNYECPDEIRDAFRHDSSGCTVNRETILAPTRTLYYLGLLVKELQAILCTHLTLPVLHLAEIIAHDVVESRSLSDLYHLRLSRTCLDLKLCQTSSFYEKAEGGVFINEIEQGRFRQEIAFKKENALKDNQKENKLFDCWEPGDVDQNTQKLSAKDKILELNPITEKDLSGLSFPYLWIDKAEVLLQLNLYQPARLLLSEAHQAAQEMNDQCTVSQCLYLLAVLANLEKNHGQAKAMLEKAQLIGGNEKFWYNSTLCFTDAILGEDREGRSKKACHFLQKNINIMRPLLMGRPNRESELSFIITHLEARKAYIQIDSAKDFIHHHHSANSVAMLLEPFDKLIHIEKEFLSNGYKDYSIEALMARADIKRILAKHTTDMPDKRSHYVAAYTLAQEAVKQMEELFRHINNMLPINEIRNVNMPLMRRLAVMKLNFIEIILDIFVLINIEKKNKEAGAEQIEQIIEEFVRFTPDAASVEQAWITLGHTIGHHALGQLTSLQTLYTDCPDIKAKYLYLTGRSLHLLADHSTPLSSDIHWSKTAVELAKTLCEKSPSPEAEANCEEAETPTPRLLLSKKQLDQYRKKASELRRRQTWTQKYLFQSTEVLLQCINIAINNNMIDILANASLEMVECIGKFDPVSAAQFLALYQSCMASVMMKEILLAATLNISSSQLAAMLHLQHNLEQKGERTSSLLKNVEQRLAAISKAWGNLCISAQHFNIMNELPPNFHVLILQHSEDRSLLYGALLQKIKSPSTKEQKEHPKEKGGKQKEKGGQHKGKSVQPTLQANIVRSTVDSDIFFSLLEKVKLVKEELMLNLVDQVLSPDATLQDEGLRKWHESSVQLNKDMEDGGKQNFESEFQAILKDMEEYLEPVLSQFDFSELRQQSPVVSPTDSGKGKGDSGKTRKGSPGKAKADSPGKSKRSEAGKTKTKNKEKGIGNQALEDIGQCVILLVDKSLMELPLEALHIFQEESISSVSRDFSLQMFYNRLHKEESETEGKKDGKGTKESKPKGEQKKGTKMPGHNRVLLPNCLPIDTHNVKYVVDPYNEARKLEIEKPEQTFKTVLEKYEPFTLRWDGFIGSTHCPSQAEWEHLLNNCSAFLFYGLERFLSHMLLDRLVAMKMTECQLMILLELVHTKPSAVRVRDLDEDRSSFRLSLELPTETVILLSLNGVHSIIANQWHTTLEENAPRLESLCENLFKVGKTTGQTVRILQRSKTAVVQTPKVELCNADSPEDNKGDQMENPSELRQPALHPSAMNTVLYGLPNLMFT